MLSGAALMQQETGISIDIVRIVQALVLLFVAADVIVRWLFGLRRAATANAQPEIASGWGATT
jgi:simple sugar transport system permease protein